MCSFNRITKKKKKFNLIYYFLFYIKYQLYRNRSIIQFILSILGVVRVEYIKI